MPVHSVPGGYQWGNHGKVYKDKASAERQGRAAYANGYRGNGSTNQTAYMQALRNKMKRERNG